MRRFIIYLSTVFLISLLIIGIILSLTQGPMNIPAMESLLTVFDTISGSQWAQLEKHQEVVILALRLPRMLLAMLVGAILAQCGVVMQGLFRNPLADPGIIGVSAGAAVGAIIAIAWLPPKLSQWSVPLSAFFAGLLTTWLVYKLAQSKNGTSVLILLLAGVAISAFAGAGIGFISYFSDDQTLRTLSLWQMGSLANTHDANLWIAVIAFVSLAIIFQKKASALNALALGESEARHLGISVESLKLQLIILTAVGVGIAVAYTGIIGFIGLVVPHFIRLTSGPNHYSLLPLSALCGAVVLVFADLLARLLVQPAELPVGIITALLGAPFFIVLLIQYRRQWN